MDWYGGGFLNIICYFMYASASQEENVLITENNLEILTENDNYIIV